MTLWSEPRGGSATPGPSRHRARILLSAVAVGAVGLVAVTGLVTLGSDSTSSADEYLRAEPLDRADFRALEPVIGAAWRSENVRATLSERLFGPGAVYCAVRADGRRLSEAWRYGETTVSALGRAVQAAREELADGESARATTLEIDLGYGFVPVEPRHQRTAFANLNRGICGLELIHQGRPTRWGPTQMIAMNTSFRRAIERWARDAGLSTEEVLREDGPVTVRIFEADQLLYDIRSGEVTPLHRGNQLVSVDEVTRDAVAALAEAQGDYLFANLQADGREVYKRWPSRGEESPANNMIRQWMATIAMGRVALRRDDPALGARVADNIAYNLAAFYHEEDGLGVIEHEGKVKLGALALAALAIVEHHGRARWEGELQALLRTIDRLAREDGSFQTFLRPADRNDDCVNFYPGETLLLWAALYERERDPALLARIMRSMRHYREWHLANRNPAFIPWHTQAYAKVYRITRDEELRDWIFAMNDWLLPVQQWDSAKAFPDVMGRFHDPARPFGPPHASSTGVYLEGLVDAFALAREAGDTQRAEAYRRAIVRGLRSLMQLTFLDDVDMFYVSERDRLRGGVRTTVYDNEVRVDNVQHGLMGMLRILDAFEAEDFRP